MKNWYYNNCKCEYGNPIIGVIINGKCYEKDAVTIEQYEKDMAALNKNNTEIRETIDVLTEGVSKKTDKTYVDAELAKKADSSALKSTNEALANATSEISKFNGYFTLVQ